MNRDDIKALIEAGMPGAEVMVAGEGNKFDVTVVSEEFASMRPVQKQQRIYACLNEHIASGVIHAVTMKTLTPEEWRRAQLFG